MLQKLSDGAKGGFSKFILVGFLFMAVAGLVLTDVGGFFRDGISSTSVANVGSEGVPYHEFDRFLRSSLIRQRINVQDAYQTGQVHDILNRYTQDIIFAQASRNLGIQTPDEAVAKELHRFVEPYITQDTTAQQALTQMLIQQGITEESFVSALRRDLTSSLLKQAILSGVDTAPTLLSQELLRYQNETRDITYINLPNERISIDNPPTEDELKELYETSKLEYRIPERRGFTIAVLDPENISYGAEPTEKDALQYYEDNKNRYDIPAGRKVEQAIFETEEEARKALEATESGTSFQEASGDQYRGENVYQDGKAPDVLKDIIFPEEEGAPDIRGPVESPLGWHIINDLGDVDTSYRPFEDVKDTILLILKKNQQREAFIDTIDTINNRIDEGDALADVATDFKMEIMDIPPIDQFGLTTDGKEGLKSFEQDQSDIIDTLFNLYEDEISQTLELQNGQLALLKDTQITPESIKPYEEVREQIEQRLIASRKRAKNQEIAQDYLNKLENGEITLQKISTDTKQQIDVARNVKRVPDAAQDNEKISVNLRARAFITDPGKYMLSQNANGFVIAKSAEPKMVKLDTPSEEAERIARQMAIVTTLSTYYNYLSEEIPVRINQHLLDQLYGQPQS